MNVPIWTLTINCTLSHILLFMWKPILHINSRKVSANNINHNVCISRKWSGLSLSQISTFGVLYAECQVEVIYRTFLIKDCSWVSIALVNRSFSLMILVLLCIWAILAGLSGILTGLCGKQSFSNNLLEISFTFFFRELLIVSSSRPFHILYSLIYIRYWSITFPLKQIGAIFHCRVHNYWDTIQWWMGPCGFFVWSLHYHGIACYE